MQTNAPVQTTRILARTQKLLTDTKIRQKSINSCFFENQLIKWNYNKKYILTLSMYHGLCILYINKIYNKCMNFCGEPVVKHLPEYYWVKFMIILKPIILCVSLKFFVLYSFIKC